MSRYFGLGQVQTFHEVADSQLSMLEEAEDAQARRVGEGFEYFSELVHV